MNLIAVAVDSLSSLGTRATSEFLCRGKALRGAFPNSTISAVTTGVLATKEEVKILQQMTPKEYGHLFVQDGMLSPSIVREVNENSSKRHFEPEWIVSDVVHFAAVKIFVDVAARHNLSVVFRGISS